MNTGCFSELVVVPELDGQGASRAGAEVGFMLQNFFGRLGLVLGARSNIYGIRKRIHEVYCVLCCLPDYPMLWPGSGTGSLKIWIPEDSAFKDLILGGKHVHGVFAIRY